MSRSELEQFVNEYLGGDNKHRERVEDLIEEVRARSRRGVDRLTELVRTEVRKEFGSFSPSRREEVAEFFERLIGLVGEYFGPGRSSRASTETKRPAATTVKKAAAKKAAVKKAAVKKAAVKKAVAKKAVAKKVAKKPAAKRAEAKKSASRRSSTGSSPGAAT